MPMQQKGYLKMSFIGYLPDGWNIVAYIQGSKEDDMSPISRIRNPVFAVF